MSAATHQGGSSATGRARWCHIAARRGSRSQDGRGSRRLRSAKRSTRSEKRVRGPMSGVSGRSSAAAMRAGRSSSPCMKCYGNTGGRPLVIGVGPRLPGGITWNTSGQDRVPVRPTTNGGWERWERGHSRFLTGWQNCSDVRRAAVSWPTPKMGRSGVTVDTVFSGGMAISISRRRPPRGDRPGAHLPASATNGTPSTRYGARTSSSPRSTSATWTWLVCAARWGWMRDAERVGSPGFWLPIWTQRWHWTARLPSKRQVAISPTRTTFWW